MVESSSFFRRKNVARLATRLLLVAVAAIIFASVFSSSSQAQRRRSIERHPAQDQPGSFVPGELIVAIKLNGDAVAMSNALSLAKVEVIRPLALKPYFLVRVKTADNKPATDQVTLDTAKQLQGTGIFRWANPNYYCWTHDTTPNDPRYNEQWQWPLINLPKVWDNITSTPGVIIADIDTGIDTNHPEFAGRIIGGQNFTVSPPDSDVHDGNGHGTHTAGLAGASSNNGVGVASVTYGGGPLWIGKVFPDSGGSPTSIIADAVMYVADNVKTPGNKVVANMSLGRAVFSDTPDLNDPLEAAVFYGATIKDIAFSISAGNDYDVGNPPSSPARAAQLDARIFCVAACGKNLEHSFFSTARSFTTICAPGGDDPSFANNSLQMLSTFPLNQGSYGFEQGTSMAAPVITGVIALLLQVGVSADQTKGIITGTANTQGMPVPNDLFGYGVVDANAAVTAALTAVTLTKPVDGSFVFGTVPVQLGVGDPSKFTTASLTIDNDPTVIATTTSSPYLLPWNSRATDPVTGALLFPNGTHKVKVAVITSGGTVTFVRTVKVDNPIAAITSPSNSGYVTKTVNVIGTSDGLRVPTYFLEYALSTAPSTFVQLATAKGKIIGSTLAQWDLTGLPDGAATLRLRVQNPDGYEVVATSAVTIDQTPPSIPTNLNGTSGNKSASLTWSPSTDPVPGLLGGYNIYRSSQSLSGYVKLNTLPLPTPGYQDGNLTNANTYFYKVTAVDAAGNESSQSASQTVTPNKNGAASGQIVGLDGTFISAATIVATNAGTATQVAQTTSDSAGQYAFASPPGFLPGSYDLTVTKPGYVPQIIQGITVDLGKDAPNENFALQTQPTLPSGWSMATLPYDFHGTDINTVFSGGTVKWYNPATGVYLNPGDAGFQKPGPGIGYYIFRTGTPNINTPGTPKSTATPVEIAIHQGWNLLGNPYQDPMQWVLNNLIIKRTDSGQQASLSVAVTLGWALDFAWGGSNGQTLIYDRNLLSTVTDTIPGYGGFWFFSSVEGTLSIAPPAVIGRSANIGSGSWVTQLIASTNTSKSYAFLGIGPTRRVMQAAPTIEAGGVKLEFTGTGTTGNAVDLKTSGASQTWDLNLTSDTDQAVTLLWPNMSQVPRGWNLSLVDKTNGSRVNLRNASSFTTSAGRAAHAFHIELSRESGQRMMITDLSVNTTRSSVPNIGFTLGKEGTATISILKSSGETVRTLSSRSAKVGQNTVVWDTKDNQGRSVAPGVYLVQVKASGDKGDAARAVVSFVITR